MTNYGTAEILDLNTSFERSLSKLSENPPKIDIGSTVLKLWLLINKLIGAFPKSLGHSENTPNV